MSHRTQNVLSHSTAILPHTELSSPNNVTFYINLGGHLTAAGCKLFYHAIPYIAKRVPHYHGYRLINAIVSLYQQCKFHTLQKHQSKNTLILCLKPSAMIPR